jgi:hypothetical protein
MGGGGPDAGMKVLAGMQQQPPPDGEKQALQDCVRQLGMVISRTQLRSAKAAKLFSEAATKIHAGQMVLEELGNSPVAAPPDLGATGGMMPPSNPGGAMSMGG